MLGADSGVTHFVAEVNEEHGFQEAYCGHNDLSAENRGFGGSGAKGRGHPRRS